MPKLSTANLFYAYLQPSGTLSAHSFSDKYMELLPNAYGQIRFQHITEHSLTENENGFQNIISIPRDTS